jgi:serine/threonine protein kinase/formylglycine-generating enzyme required for sulfatase activity
MSSIKSCPFCSEEILANAIKCKHCGSDLQDTMSTSLYVNTSIRLALGDKYEILEVVGKGGMSTVYKAKQKNLNRLVAIKVVHPNLVHDTEFLNRFHKEAQMAASLTHPNIVMIFDEGSLNGVHFIAMEYLEGKDLHCILQEKGKLSVDETIKIIKPIAEALDFAHSKGLVHRDVKSANILVTDSGRPVLTDFGIAHAASGTKLTQAGSVIGTPEYMSPEQAEGKDLDGRSDIFSLGVVMYECLTGKVPFKGDNPLTTIYGIIYDSTPSLKSINAKIPGWLDATVMCALAKSPNERFPTGKVLSEHLNEKKTPSGSFKKLQVKPIKVKSEKQNTKTSDKISNKTLIGLIVLFTVVIITATFLYLRQAPNGGIFGIKGNKNEAVIPLNDITNLVNEASILFNEKKYEDAQRKYSEAQVLQPDNTEVKEKIKEINDIITKNNEIQKLTVSADKYFEKGDMSNARNDYSKILVLDSQNEHATKQILVVDQKIKINTGIQNEESFRRNSYLGDSLRRKGQFEGAKTAYEKALRIKPNDENIKKNLDDVNFNIANNEADAEIIIKNARIDLNAGRFSAGKDKLTEALKLVPGNPRIIKSLDSLNNDIIKKIQTEINNNLITVQGGRFEMGYNSADENQKPAHWITLATFQIDKYEVSVKQYKLFCNATGRAMPPVPAWGWKDDDPIVNVKWEDAKAYANWAGKRLPTEAEWEYAALGGSETKGNKYSGSSNAGSVATYAQIAITKPKSIGSNAPNELGIFDMSGNVWEWCSDYYSADYYKNSSPENPQGPLKGELRVIRGGGWNSPTKEIMIKTRGFRNGNNFENSGGFRCVKN